MKKEFVMRGQTVSSGEEVLNFSGHKKGYAYRLIEFQLYPSTNIGTTASENRATITAAKTAEDPINPNFNNEGLIGVAMMSEDTGAAEQSNSNYAVINDAFLITQDLIIAVRDTDGGNPINWQCRFVSEKMNLSQEAVANYNQFTIFDE